MKYENYIESREEIIKVIINYTVEQVAKSDRTDYYKGKVDAMFELIDRLIINKDNKESEVDE